METPGLVSWITCECIKNVLATSVEKNHSDFREKFSDKTSLLYKLVTRLESFYTGTISKSFDLERLYKFLFNGYKSFYPYSSCFHLKYLLLDSGRMVSVSDAFLRHFIYAEELPFNWLANIPLANSVVKPLISECIKLNSHALPKLLQYINTLFFAYHLPYAPPLLSQEVNRILKIARNENDVSLLRGAFLAVSTSKFIKSAGSDLILKLIQNNHTDANLISSLLFERRYKDSVEIDSKQDKIITEVAKRIINDPGNYAFKVVCSASSYLVEREPLNLPPLIHEEEVLDLKVRKSSKI